MMSRHSANLVGEEYEASLDSLEIKCFWYNTWLLEYHSSYLPDLAPC